MIFSETEPSIDIIDTRTTIQILPTTAPRTTTMIKQLASTAPPTGENRAVPSQRDSHTDYTSKRLGTTSNMNEAIDIMLSIGLQPTITAKKLPLTASPSNDNGDVVSQTDSKPYNISILRQTSSQKNEVDSTTKLSSSNAPNTTDKIGKLLSTASPTDDSGSVVSQTDSTPDEARMRRQTSSQRNQTNINIKLWSKEKKLNSTDEIGTLPLTASLNDSNYDYHSGKVCLILIWSWVLNHCRSRGVLKYPNRFFYLTSDKLILFLRYSYRLSIVLSAVCEGVCV